MNSVLSFLVLLFAVSLPSTGWAHALLIASYPKDNTVITEPPLEVVLHFNSRIEKRVSTVTLLDAKGQKIALPSSPRGLISGRPDSLIVPMPPLGPGAYRVQYTVLAADGHSTPGLIHFAVSGKNGT